jgi:murein DD-endopeptidase MepM/ murein hydrolase activator NlpD
LYRLPYAEDTACMISQAPGGIVTTHTTAATMHAVDFAMPEGTPVLAARKGTVIGVEWRHERGGRSFTLVDKGNYVRVRHEDGTIATYAHLMPAGVAVEPGETVPAGKILGYSGATGFASGPHLHFVVTREVGADGTVQEVSVPVTFYVGEPPVAFAPRAGLAVTANYSSPAQPPPPPGAHAARRAPWPAYASSSGRAGELELLLACVLALVGIAWFYRFSRR